MLNRSLSALLLFTLAQSSYAEQATFSEEFSTALLVNLLIIAVYALYWLKQKT